MASSPTELELSPSKARQAATTSLAWTRITSWLTTLLWPAPVPPFEQNPATLAYLQQLMHANLAADQVGRLQAEVEREQLLVFDDDQQQSANRTCTAPAGAASLPLKTKLVGAQAEAELEQMRLRTAQWARESKQIGLKTDEYERRIAALARHVEDVDHEYDYDRDSDHNRGVGEIEASRQRLARVESKRSEIRALEQRLRGFHGLPPDLDASQDEVKRAQLELDRWKSKREEMFEQL
ncbi:hypothetical protein DV735_g5869, partial [Chaetothyriales sp. CBS 134920]